MSNGRYIIGIGSSVQLQTNSGRRGSQKRRGQGLKKSRAGKESGIGRENKTRQGNWSVVGIIQMQYN